MLNKESLLEMAEIKDQWCVSIYMPIRKVDGNKNNIRLKNLISKARKKLLALEMYPQKISSLLAPIDIIIDNAEFWRDRSEGFVSFFTSGSFVWYSLSYDFKELVVVTDRLHIKPLLRIALRDRTFHILTLSQNQIRFFEASEMGINELFLKGLPRNLGNKLAPKTEKSLQMHSGGKGSAIIHGQSINDDLKKSALFKSSNIANKVISSYLERNETPLLLAGVEYLHPIYRESNSYKHLLEKGIIGNVDRLSPKSLLKKALPLVRPEFQVKRQNAVGSYEEKVGTGLATDNFSEIFTASIHGRIDTLFVPVGKHKWGTFDEDTTEFKVHARAKAGDKDLLCVASTNTLSKGGKVFAVLPEQMPNSSTAAAILRY